jgi:ATP/maltotriose-dependent transcriptional regulator MalT
MDSQAALDDSLAAGREALKRGDWPEAREHFEKALGLRESGEAWEGLGWAGWWLHDGELTFHAREQAYRAYRAEEDAAAAVRVAAWLASDFLEFRGEASAARGWLERGRRLLDGLPEGESHGWLALNEASYAANVEGDMDTTTRLAVEATELGRKLGVADLEAVGLAQQGATLVRTGLVEEGMRLLDEASVIAASEELELPIARGWALCYLISACEGVGDFSRATAWCDAVRAIAERWGARMMLGVCRSAYGNVLASCGDWRAAELELTAAVIDLKAARPGMAAGGIARLGELRARQGRADEARALFEEAGSHRIALVGLGKLALDSGDAEGAVAAAERALRRLPPAAVLDRVPAFELLVRGRLASGSLEPAREGADEVERIAAELGTPYMRGRACLVAAQVAAAQGEHEEARRGCEDAVDLLVEAGATYETALARVELAGVLEALGRSDAAQAERDAAHEAFGALGAHGDVVRVGPARAEAELSPRELEVLRLVAQGLSDAEIAERLVLSQHTVHRHVANVRTKLRLPSRAAAVAYAAREGLL